MAETRNAKKNKKVELSTVAQTRSGAANLKARAAEQNGKQTNQKRKFNVSLVLMLGT